MRNKLGWLGGLLTAVYFSCLLLLIWGRIPNLLIMDLNAIGDFLAGAFGPIAFLWLVLGFFQQGKELQLSSEALQLQAKELKESVLQQTAMVALQSAQLSHQDLATDPILRLGWLEHVVSGTTDRQVFAIKNSGHSCQNVDVVLLANGRHPIYARPDALDEDETFQFEIDSRLLAINKTYELYVHYEKYNEKKRTQFFAISQFKSSNGYMVNVLRQGSVDRDVNSE